LCGVKVGILHKVNAKIISCEAYPLIPLGDLSNLPQTPSEKGNLKKGEVGDKTPLFLKCSKPKIQDPK